MTEKKFCKEVRSWRSKIDLSCSGRAVEIAISHIENRLNGNLAHVVRFGCVWNAITTTMSKRSSPLMSFPMVVSSKVSEIKLSAPA
jgi:hypothetical protein